MHNRTRAAVALLVMALAVPTSLTIPAQAKPGCLKYGAVGAVGGHFAGHHALLGAAGGCAVGVWRRHHARKIARARAGWVDGGRTNAPAPYRSYYPDAEARH